MKQRYDFLAIGDTVTDAFIRLMDPAAHIDIDHGRREICMGFADKVPYDDVYIIPAVGNSANAAVSAARLGLKSALVSNVGNDYFGQECLDALKKEKVAGKFVKVNKGAKTNYHYILWYEDDRTILVKHEEYEYKLPNIGKPRWVYLSSLGANSFGYHEEIAEHLETNPEVKLAFQPGTFQMKFGKDRLARIYKRSNLFFCNKEEAQRILETDEADIKKLLELMALLGPEIVVITDGVKGAYAYDGSTSLTTGGGRGLSTSSGQNSRGEFWFMRPYPDPKPPFERTGAGDAFSSTFTAAMALGMDMKTAFCWAPINSMSVVQQIGARAGLLTRNQIEKFLSEAPADYKPKQI